MGCIAYRYHNNLYLNITNRCPCDCTFCLRNDKDSVGQADSLWLDHDPDADEVMAAIAVYDDELAHNRFDEVVYCGYGEPFCNYEVMLEVARRLKARPRPPRIRVNTNGLGDSIVGHSTADSLVGLIDALSISLNAPTPEKYNELCRPQTGLDALPEIIAFTQSCRAVIEEVTLSIVDVLQPSDIEACRDIARELGVSLRVRSFV